MALGAWRGVLGLPVGVAGLLVAVGLMIGLWAAPTMTVAHLVFAVMCTSYIFVGARLEEHDLENVLPEYKQYKKDVPMFLPGVSSNRGKSITAEAL